MFIGEYQHALDDKGRLVLPVKFRADLAHGCVVTKGQEGCLYVLPLEQWEAMASEVSALPLTDKRGRTWGWVFFGSSEELTLDRQGRVAIPGALRQWAGLDKEVAVVGVNTRIELWEPEAWAAYLADGEDEYVHTEERIGETL